VERARARARVAGVTSSTPDALWSSRAVRLLRPAAVVCEGLRRRDRGGAGLNGVNLWVPVGARLLLVGDPDGAATMLLRVLAGLAHRDAGRIRIAGTDRRDSSPEGWGRRIAYVGPETGLYPWMSAAEVLELAARLALLDRQTTRRRTAEAVERWGLAVGLERPMRRVGLAHLQRTAMAAAMLGDPEVVFLDEPLRAVDPDERIRLLRLPGERRTMLLASRYPATETGCVSQAALIRGGRVAVRVPVATLEQQGLPLSKRSLAALADAPRAANGDAPTRVDPASGPSSDHRASA
jgi:ABC-2 type transport system ATP-binding protein